MVVDAVVAQTERYLYVPPGPGSLAVVRNDRLAATTERHQIAIEVGEPLEERDPIAALTRSDDVRGVIIGLATGVPTRERLDLASAVLARGRPAWLYWPNERAVECLDAERLRSLERLRFGVAALQKVGRRVRRLVEAWRRVRPGLGWIRRGDFPIDRAATLAALERAIVAARPVPFGPLPPEPSPARPIDAGLYLRLDFWLPALPGGSYGHTCYVARELNAVTSRFACLVAQRYDLLDSLGVRQVVLANPESRREDAFVGGSDHYYPILKAACEAFRPSYVYERLCLGNWAMALVSRDLQIPYIVEYNGSEISMQRSFGAKPPIYEDVCVKAEEVAFRQAAVISVVSERVKADLVARGIDASRILVNPNGADLERYAPAETEDEKQRLRADLGFHPRDRVVGFTGTFGGWHGIDVLASALPRICATADDVRFLLIGDGPHKAMLDAEVSRHGLGDRVRSVGRVAQDEGARLMKTCDLFVSPHHAHMVDGRFFGSPTKIFEYMAMAGGIVASDFEQIGEVLSPALRVADLARPDCRVSDERSVLCAPGDVDEFVSAVVALARRPDLCHALGRNARRAVAERYSWQRNVARLWAFAACQVRDSSVVTVQTGDEYKQQIQHQWNHNPVGAESARRVQAGTLDWYLEVERHRYGTYAPWMPRVMEFAAHSGEAVLEVGGGLGTDLAQFAKHGAVVTDVDLSAAHLALAENNFRLRGLSGTFVHHDAESLPFDDNRFDLVYSNGVLHHTPNTLQAIREILRVLKPGGRAIVMVYAEHSLQYWRDLVWYHGVIAGGLSNRSMADVMSRAVEQTANDARPLVKVYTKPRLRSMFGDFTDVVILQRQISPELVPRVLRPLRPVMERLAGWNLVVKARKPAAARVAS